MTRRRRTYKDDIEFLDDEFHAMKEEAALLGILAGSEQDQEEAVDNLITGALKADWQGRGREIAIGNLRREIAEMQRLKSEHKLSRQEQQGLERFLQKLTIKLAHLEEQRASRVEDGH